MQVNMEYKVGDVIKFRDFGLDGEYFLLHFGIDIGCINYIDETYDTCSIFSFKEQRMKNVKTAEIIKFHISPRPNINALKEL